MPGGWKNRKKGNFLLLLAPGTERCKHNVAIVEKYDFTDRFMGVEVETQEKSYSGQVSFPQYCE